MNKLVEWKAFVDTYGIESADLKNKLLFTSFAAFHLINTLFSPNNKLYFRTLVCGQGENLET